MAFHRSEVVPGASLVCAVLALVAVTAALTAVEARAAGIEETLKCALCSVRFARRDP